MAIVNTHYGFCAKGGAAVKFTYSGEYNVRDDGVVELLTSGYIVFLEPKVIDVFMVGGGGAGWTQQTSERSGFGGGGGGYTRTVRKVSIDPHTPIEVTIGAGGVAPNRPGGSSGFNALAVNGGSYTGVFKGSDGGSGGGGGVASNSDYGAGGSDGNNGENGYPAYSNVGGYGQGFTTREFGEATGKLYAGGGGGGRYMSSQTPIISMGGAGGGGSGCWIGASSDLRQAAAAGVANTGGGGGGGAAVTSSNYEIGGSGGSGIVCFRNAAELPELAGTWKLNARIYPPETPFDFTANYTISPTTPSPSPAYTRIYVAGNKLIGTSNIGATQEFYDFATNRPSATFGYFWTDATQSFTDEFRAWLASNATKQS